MRKLLQKFVGVLLLFAVADTALGARNPFTFYRTKRSTFDRCHSGQFACSNGKCIDIDWRCDRDNDCGDYSDEEDCDGNRALTTTSPGLNTALQRRYAVTWVKNQRQSASATEKWGPLVHKFAVALYLADPDFTSESDPTREEITYELIIQLLSRLAVKEVKDISSTDLASFINGLLVTCLDPGDFYGVNLIQELRTRVDSLKYTNPYLLLTLCNAGQDITEADMQKLKDSFQDSHREFWTETQAIAVMAMACARTQSESAMDSDEMKELTTQLKQRQYANGTVENLQTTALVLQALNSAEPEEDPDNFDNTKAMEQIISQQQNDGSFGNFMKTYYVLPALAQKSLVNISSSHCQTAPRSEDSTLNDLVNLPVPKIRIHYSLWIGDQTDIERTLTMRVPSNTSFYGIMEIASNIDDTYKFEYTVKNQKPYINMVSGIMDDPEKGTFWFPYLIENEKPMPIGKSPADVIPKENNRMVMWYRRGPWAE